MKLYLRVVPENKRNGEEDPRQKNAWDKYGMVGHAMSSYRVMTEKEICWEYIKYEAQEYYESDLLNNVKPEYFHASMIEVETIVKEGLAALIEVGLTREL